MASLNPFRRNSPTTLLASGETVDINKQSAVDAVLKRREQWQRDAGKAFDASGLVHYGTTQISDLMSGLVIFAAEQPTDKDAKPVRSTAEEEVSTVERLGTIAEIGQILYDLTTLLVLIGEAQLIGIQPGPGRDIDVETWIAYSHLELEQATFIREDGSLGNTVRIPQFRDGEPLTLDPTLGDTWVRLWRPHPLRRNKADSHVRPLLEAVDELLWWNHAAKSVAQNRLATAGLVGLPSNLELPAEAGEPAGLSGGQRFARRLFNTAIKTIQNPGLASAAVPGFFTYPWNESGKSGVEVINFDRPQDALLEQRVDRCERTIAQGFPLPVESFFGIGEAAYGQGRQITENKFQENVEPFARFLLATLTQAWYRPILKLDGVKDYEKKILWYDASNLIVHPDVTQAADKGYEYGLVSPEAWRRTRGFSERDKMSDEQRAEALVWLRGLRGRDASKPSDENPPVTDPQADPPTDDKPIAGHPPIEQPAAPVRGKGQPIMASVNGHSSLGRRLAEIDADLLSRVQVMADSAMRREQERAGNKLKLRASKNTRIKQTIKGVAATDIASTLGRETVVTLGLNDLFSDAFDNVPDQFGNWCDRAVISAFEVANLQPSVMQADAGFQLSYAVQEASDLLVRDLRELALTLLFDRAASLGPSPESDDLLVPASLIRRALNRAGGNASPSLLLATGHAVAKVLGAQAGLYPSEYSFWWTPKPRSPFEAHQKLDGQSFSLDNMADRFNDTDDCHCIAIPLFG